MNIIEMYRNKATETDVVVAILQHLDKQGCRATNEYGGGCVYYESTTGAMCAVGALLPHPETFAWDSDSIGIEDMCRGLLELSTGKNVRDYDGELPWTVRWVRCAVQDKDEVAELAAAIKEYLHVLSVMQGFHDKRDFWTAFDGCLIGSVDNFFAGLGIDPAVAHTIHNRIHRTPTPLEVRDAAAKYEAESGPIPEECEGEWA